MYNNRQGGIYMIRGDMCYENKAMSNSVSAATGTHESVRLQVSEQEHTNRGAKSSQKSKLYKIQLAYIFNILVIIIVGVTLCFIEFNIIPTQNVGYYCRDPALSYPFLGDTISATALIVGSLVGPLLILLPVEFRRGHLKTSIRIVWVWYKEMLVGLTITLMLTEVMKAIFGAHRPHFIATCTPNTEANCTPGEFVYHFECTNNVYSFYTIGDSSKSFPSGHTSISVFVSLYCAAFLHYRCKIRRLGELARPFLIFICLIWGPLCGLTRITDRRHHWWDVLAGAVLAVAGVTYTIVALAKNFQLPPKDNRSASTTTLIEKNRHSASVII